MLRVLGYVVPRLHRHLVQAQFRGPLCWASVPHQGFLAQGEGPLHPGRHFKACLHMHQLQLIQVLVCRRQTCPFKCCCRLFDDILWQGDHRFPFFSHWQGQGQHLFPSRFSSLQGWARPKVAFQRFHGLVQQHGRFCYIHSVSESALLSRRFTIMSFRCLFALFRFAFFPHCTSFVTHKHPHDGRFLTWRWSLHRVHPWRCWDDSGMFALWGSETRGALSWHSSVIIGLALASIDAMMLALALKALGEGLGISPKVETVVLLLLLLGGLQAIEASDVRLSVPTATSL